MHRLSNEDEQIVSASPPREEEAGHEPIPGSMQESSPILEGQGELTYAVTLNNGGPMRLQGRTDANYDGCSY
jgi:hypothetical protein